MEQQVVSGIAYSQGRGQGVDPPACRTGPGVSAAIFGPLAEANISVDMIVQNVSRRRRDGQHHLHAGDAATAAGARGARDGAGQDRLSRADARRPDVAKVSVVGIGMRSHAGVAAQMFKALAEKGINIQAITTSEIKVSVLIDEAYTELAVRALHACVYELDSSAVSS